MARPLARELAFASVEVMPMLSEPSLSMVRAFEDALGWEVRDAPGPLVNVWARFVLDDGGVVQSFAVGGVMRMGVRSVGDGGPVHLVVGDWVGSVVVERLG